MLELYHWEPDTESAKILICLREKGLDYKSHYVDVLKFEQSRPEFQKMNPESRVPVLVHDNATFIDTKLISQYIVEAFPNPRLAPEDAMGWYNVQAWENVLDGASSAIRLLGWNTVMMPAMSAAEREAFTKKLKAVQDEQKDAGWSAVFSDAVANEDQLENARDTVRDTVAQVEKALEESPWLAGNEYSVADIFAFALLHTVPRLLPDTANDRQSPRMMDWLQRIGDRPAVKEALADRRISEPADIYAPPL